MKIRKATLKDLKDIALVMKEEFIKQPYNEKWEYKYAVKTLQDYWKSGFFYVAEVEKKFAGFIIFTEHYYNDGKNAMIEELIVKEEFQNKGIGKALIKKAEQECLKKGVKKIYLSTSRKAPAFGFYKKQGYDASKETVFMRKMLK